MNRRRVALRSLAVVFLVVVIAMVKWPQPWPRWLGDLSDHALAHGRVGTIPAEALVNLKLPTGDQRDIPFGNLVVSIGSQSHIKSFCVRQRGQERDVLLSDARPNRGRFFHSSLDAKLISASIVNEKLTAEEVQTAFLDEIQFWRDWWHNSGGNN